MSHLESQCRVMVILIVLRLLDKLLNIVKSMPTFTWAFYD